MKTERAKTTVKFVVLVLGAASIVCLGATVRAQTAPAKTEGHKSHEVDVAATKEWVDTKIDLRGGAKLRFTPTGKMTYPPDQSYAGKSKTLGTFGPDGLARRWADLIHQYPVNEAGHGALNRPHRFICECLFHRYKQGIRCARGRSAVPWGQSKYERCLDRERMFQRED